MNMLEKCPNLKELKRMLAAAIQLEHVTIPPYMTALYSIHPETNIEAVEIIRAVLVEEMLHMTLAANLLNSIGGRPNLLADQFVVNYPAKLPDGEKDFEVHIAKFDQENLKTFLKIERPSHTNFENHDSSLPKGCFKKNNVISGALASTFMEIEGKKHSFYSIGDFYEAILDAMRVLETRAYKNGESIFIKDSSSQINSKYFYSGGGKIIKVTGLDTAIKAIRLIQEQGEGYDKGIFDEDGEISHYYRFHQLKKRKFYRSDDKPGKPTGKTIKIDWNAVYNMIKNPKVAMFDSSSELYAAAKKFNVHYRNILVQINKAYNGQQHLLLDAIPLMFRLKECAVSLMRNPIHRKHSCFGGPTFEISNTTVEAETNFHE